MLPRYLQPFSLWSKRMPAVPVHTEEESDGQSESQKPLFLSISTLSNAPLARPLLRHEVFRVCLVLVNIILDLGTGEAEP